MSAAYDDLPHEALLRPNDSHRTSTVHSPAGSPSHIFVLIHGTFAHNAEWTQPSSTLSTSLARFPNGNVKRFGWSGANTHVARLEAAEQLASMLLSSAAEHPSAEHYVIAHSHGGMVAAYALRKLRLQHVAGVITLGTPSISCRPRRVDRLLTPSLSAATFATSIVGIALAYYYSVLYVRGTFPAADRATAYRWVKLYAASALLIPAASVLILWLTRSFGLGHRWFASIQHQTPVLQDVQFPEALQTPFLCFRVFGDEALLWLTLLRAQITAAHGLFVCAVIGLVALTVLPVAVCLDMSHWYITASDQYRIGPSEHSRSLLWLVPLLCACMLVIEVVAVLLFIAVLAILQVLFRNDWWAFGEQGVLRNLFLSVRTHRYPPFVKRFEARCYLRRSEWFGHSTLYVDSRILSEISSWLAIRGR